MNEQLSLAILEVFLSIEAAILENVVKYLQKPKTNIEDDIIAWQIEALSMLGKLSQENLIVIAKKSGVALDTLIELLEQVGYSAVSEVDTDLQTAVIAGSTVQPVSATSSASLVSILSTYAQQAKDLFNLVNSTLLQQSGQIYTTIINNTVGKVLAGVTTPQKALAETAAEWAKNGVPALVDKAGKKWSVEGYVNTVIRSTTNNVANDMQLERFKEYDVDLIEVSSHVDARPKCRICQGRIYSLSGKSKKYPAWSTSTYGELDGLLGINCRHKIYAYIEGKSRKTYEPYPEAMVDKAYKQSQQQRKLERNIRDAKKQLKMYEALGDTKQIKTAKAKVRQRQSQMRDFINETGRTRRSNREQIV
jgi:hypothetical protein